MGTSSKGSGARAFAALTVASLSLGCASTRTGHATAATTTFNGSEQVQPATAVLRKYEAALNRGDVEAIVSLYASDAVFMAQHSEPGGRSGAGRDGLS